MNRDFYIKKAKKMMIQKGLSKRTQSLYTTWIIRFLKFVNDVTEKEIVRFLKSLNGSSSTMNLAMSSISFFTRNVLEEDIKVVFEYRKKNNWGDKIDTITYEEANLLFSMIRVLDLRVMAMLIYYTGIRNNEVLRVRRHDVGIVSRELWVRDDNDNRSRKVSIPDVLIPILIEQLEYSKIIFHNDKEKRIYPYIEQKPKKIHEGLGFLVPSVSARRKGRNVCRYSRCETTLRKALLRDSKNILGKSVTLKMLRMSFLFRLFDNSESNRTIAKIMGLGEETVDILHQRYIHTISSI